MVNALGLKTVPWNFSQNRPYANAEWVVEHDRMIGVIQRTIHEKMGRWPVLFLWETADDAWAPPFSPQSTS